MTNDSPGPTIQPAYDGAPLDEPGQGVAEQQEGRPASTTFLARLRRGWRGAPRSAEVLPMDRQGQLGAFFGIGLVVAGALYVLWMFLNGSP